MGVFPDHLAQMTPALELAHVDVVVTELVTVFVELVIVEAVGENGGEVARLDTTSNVLSITSTAGSTKQN